MNETLDALCFPFEDIATVPQGRLACSNEISHQW